MVWLILFFVVLGVVAAISEWSDSRSIEKYEKQKHKEWLSYQSPQSQDYNRIATRHDKRREKGLRARHELFDEALKRGYRFRKYTENKSYAAWEDEQTEKNGRKWDWKLEEEWNAELDRHIKKWGKSPYD
jgi:hypothetical protein